LPNDRLIATSQDSSLIGGTPSFPDVWWEKFSGSSELVLATGYVSVGAVTLLQDRLRENPKTKVRILVGMAVNDGLTLSQKKALADLDSSLRNSSRGGVFVSRSSFHGKFTIFEDMNGTKSAVLGSSNMSGILPIARGASRNVEIDFEVGDSASVAQLVRVSELLLGPTECWTLDEALELIRTVAGPLESLVGQPFIEEPGSNEYLNLVNNYEPGIPFLIPLSTQDSSSLNAFFGAPRKQKNGKSSPRDWYEVSLVVPTAARLQSIDYPLMMEFFVVTDDGYSFVGKTSGTAGKNFSSRKNNRLIGRWIKGRLEEAGLLARGQRITDQMLLEYGANALTLQKTKAVQHDELRNKPLPVYVMSFKSSHP
jgi:hypothetical protein